MTKSKAAFQRWRKAINNDIVVALISKSLVSPHKIEIPDTNVNEDLYLWNETISNSRALNACDISVKSLKM